MSPLSDLITPPLLQAERALRTERARLEALLRHLPNGVIIAEAPSGKLILSNEQASRILDRAYVSASDVAQYADFKGFHSDGRAYLPGEWPLARSIATGERVEQEEIRFERGDGSMGWMSVNAAPIYEQEGGRIVAGVATFSDVTQRKEMEESLQRTADQMRLIADTAPVNIGQWDKGIRCVFVNEAFASRFGLTPAQCLGRHMLEIIGPTAFELFRPHAEAVLKGTPVVFEAEVPYAKIGSRFMHCAFAPAHAPGGAVIGFVGASADITDRRRSEENLLETERRLQLALSSARLAVWETEADTGITTMSEAGEALWGFRQGTVEDFARMIHPEDVQRVKDSWRQTLTGPRRFSVDYRVIREGKTFWYTTSAEAIYTGNASSPRLVGITADNSEQIKAKAELDAALKREQGLRERAEDASRAKDQFLATLSHELRTPLTPVLMAAQLIETDPRLPGDLREDVSLIRRNVELESRLISDLLDLTRITAGKLQMEWEVVDLHATMRDAVQVCDHENSPRCILDLQARHYMVRGDHTRLQQIFWNLISNAIKFTAPSGTITIQSRNTAEDCIHVEVIDTGIGIDPSVMPRLFNAFEQGDARLTRRQAGLGLGLTISRKLVEAHGGEIHAQSKGRGKGATFSVDLPTICTAAAGGCKPPGGAQSTPARHLNILLVEDDVSTTRMMVKLLGTLGHRVTEADSVSQALQRVREKPFDVLISDVGLPDGSGHDLMKQVRAQFSGRAIALSGYGMESDVAASHDAGFAQHLTKPVDFAILQAAICRVAESESIA